MPTEIDARITPSLHSENVKQLDGYSDDSAPYLGPVMEALDDAYLTLGKLHDARHLASKNQAWTPEQAVLAVSDPAGRQQQRRRKAAEVYHGDPPLQSPRGPAAFPLHGGMRPLA